MSLHKRIHQMLILEFIAVTLKIYARVVALNM